MSSNCSGCLDCFKKCIYYCWDEEQVNTEEEIDTGVIPTPLPTSTAESATGNTLAGDFLPETSHDNTQPERVESPPSNEVSAINRPPEKPAVVYYPVETNPEIEKNQIKAQIASSNPTFLESWINQYLLERCKPSQISKIWECIERKFQIDNVESLAEIDFKQLNFSDFYKELVDAVLVATLFDLREFLSTQLNVDDADTHSVGLYHEMNFPNDFKIILVLIPVDSQIVVTAEDSACRVVLDQNANNQVDTKLVFDKNNIDTGKIVRMHDNLIHTLLSKCKEIKSDIKNRDSNINGSTENQAIPNTVPEAEGDDDQG